MILWGGCCFGILPPSLRINKASASNGFAGNRPWTNEETKHNHETQKKQQNGVGFSKRDFCQSTFTDENTLKIRRAKAQEQLKNSAWTHGNSIRLLKSSGLLTDPASLVLEATSFNASAPATPLITHCSLVDTTANIGPSPPKYVLFRFSVFA